MQEPGGWFSDYFSCFLGSVHNSPPSGAVPVAFYSLQALPPSDEVSTTCSLVFKGKTWHTHTLLTSASKQSDSAWCVISCLLIRWCCPLPPLLASQRLCSNKHFSVRDSFVLFWLFSGRGLDDVKNETKQQSKNPFFDCTCSSTLCPCSLLFKARLYRKLQKNSFLHFLLSHVLPSPVQTSSFHHCTKINQLLFMSFWGYNPATVLSEFFRLFSWFIPLNTFCALNSLTLFSLVCLFSCFCVFCLRVMVHVVLVTWCKLRQRPFN